MAPQLITPVLPKPGTLFLGTMTHNGQLDYLMAKAFYMTPTREREVFYMPRQSSLLAAAYNHLWCYALNNREKHNLKYFAILHSDIVPEDFWCDKLIAELEKYDADVMSAIVPIKENSGVTSTALSGPDNFTRALRLTMKQVWHPGRYETFGIKEMHDEGWQVEEDAKLLVNTGCFVARLDRPWCSRVHFTINDRIRVGIGGQLISETEPEDWFFSRRVAEEGGKVMATRTIKLDHMGGRAYKSHEVWGSEVDPAAL